MRTSVFLTVLLLAGSPLLAQNQGATWIFGDENAVTFVSGMPVNITLPNTGGGPPYGRYEHAGAVNNAAGALRFWIKLINTNTAAYYNVYSNNGIAMPNGSFAASQYGDCTPVIVPAPGDTDRYYIFYNRNGGLLYSAVDMRLNGGLGDVAGGRKNILLGSYSSIIDQKMVAVPGCDGAWIVVRSRNTNVYYSYHIGVQGVDPVAVASTCGTLPYNWYGGPNDYGGLLKAAPGGRKLAAACGTGLPGNSGYPLRGGVELYDFDPCSGQVSNPQLLDTGYYYGVCFSPDNSKLYATRRYERTLWQFDVSQPTQAAIRASRTLILTNPSYNTSYADRYLLGDIKAAKDGRLYIGNHKCWDYPYTNALHTITAPDRAGLACGPALNAFPMAGTGGSSCTGLNLPADVISIPKRDTVRGPVRVVYACFRDSILIQVGRKNRCIRWEDGSDSYSRTVARSGSYTVMYRDTACTLHIDAYSVHFDRQQLKTGGSYACPGSNTGKVWVTNHGADTSASVYTWADAAGAVLRSYTGTNGDTLAGLDTGRYTVRIARGRACDTMLTIRVWALPKPQAIAAADTVICKNSPATFTCLAAVPWCSWSFGPGQVYHQLSVTRSFGLPGSYRALLTVRNPEGCSDTLWVQTSVLSLDLDLQASPQEADPGTIVQLRAGANASFQVLAWMPVGYFPDQARYDQQVKADSATRFTVIGRSADGCVDSASVTARIRPRLFIPTAFSPNGDGKNDLFRVRSYGNTIFIRQMIIYNRWGRIVFSASGAAANAGWDGRFMDTPAESGVYFYLVDTETPGGINETWKGDVTLMR